MNTIKSCLLRMLFYFGIAFMLKYYKEELPQHELLAILAMVEVIVASCPFIKTK